MKARWFAFLIPAVLAFGFAQDADADGYGKRYGHHGHSQSHDYRHDGYRRRDYRVPAHGSYKYDYRGKYRGKYRGAYRGKHRGYRHGYRKGYRHDRRAAWPAYRHGYRKGRGHGYSRGYRHTRPLHYRGGITLHFGY